MNGQDLAIVLGVLAVLLFGAGVGLVNGLVITKLRVNAFIATLGMALIRGLRRGELRRAGHRRPDGFQRLGFESVGPVPVSVVLLLAVVAGAWLLLRYSRFGNRLYAVGGDEEVAKLSGVRTHRVTILAHVLCAVAAAITGLFIASRLGAGVPRSAIEGGYDLESIAAVVLGAHLSPRWPRRACSARWRACSSSRCSTTPSTSSRSMHSPGRRARRDHHRRGCGLLGALAPAPPRGGAAAGGQTAGPEPAVEGAR